jgi:tripartite-type tricarboxylate transporter receptor subunit TctC
MHYIASTLAALLGLAGLLTALLVAAQGNPTNYPSKPIRLIVPFPAGGPTDVIGRTAAKIIQDALGQPVVVENRPGAGGVIGTDLVTKAPADGYTLGIATVSALTVAPHMMAKVPFDPIRDVAPITNLAITVGALLAHPKLPANNVRELVALAKAEPGKLAYASPGVGTIVQLGMEHFALVAGLKFSHIPYKGAAPALADLLSGAILLSAESSLTTVVPNVRAGKLKALAVMSKTRSALLPDVPTATEAGYPTFDTSAWFGLVGPGGTSREIVTRLNQVTVAGLRDKDTIERLGAIGADVIGDTPEQFARTIRTEYDRWGQVVKATGAKAE